MTEQFDYLRVTGRPYIIAEAGVNYYDFAQLYNISLIDAAKLMIDKAVEARCDAIKFQSYKAETLASRNSPAYWDTTKESTASQFELFKKYDKFGFEEYKELSEYCREKNINFLCTPFDFESADYLDQLMDFYKISSSDITNLPFIEHIAQKGKWILLSTGAATLGEINQAVKTIRCTGNIKICLMHCILDYPTKLENANLGMIRSIRNNFPEYLIGYSDHTLPDKDMLVVTAAYVLGAIVIEKHFTLNKSLSGNDHYHAGDVADFRKLRDNLDFLQRAWGSNIKEVCSCEEKSRMFARRSIYAKCDIPAGTVIMRDQLIMKRPGVGIVPGRINEIIGKRAAMNISEDEMLTEDNLMN